MIPTFIRAYAAAAAILPHRIVTFAAPTTDTTITTAAAGTAAVIGVSDAMGAEIGEMCDVHRAGLVSVRLGGTVSAGDLLMSDATGRAILAVAASGTTIRTIGVADMAGVVSDIIDVWVTPGILHEA